MAGIAFTDRELDVMRVLWSRGSATAAEVREELPDALAYSTVITVLRILEQKGHVDHVEEGRTHRFRPLVDREEAGRSAVRRVLDKVFDGSAEMLLTQLLTHRGLDDEAVRRMRRLLDERLGSAKPEGGRPPGRGE